MNATTRKMMSFKLALAGSLMLSASALAADIEVIYTEIASSPTGNAPGMVDPSGNPITAPFFALFDLNVNWDGSQWAVRADTTVTDTFDQVVILGSGTVGNAYLQDGQPVPGGAPGENWDFFDPRPLTWDEKGNIGFSARAKGGVSAVKEKIVKVLKGTPTVVYTESSPTTGLVDIPANPTGDELIGNSVGSVQLLNDGQIFFVNTPVQNCSSFRYPAVFKDNAGFAQSGVTAVGFETWDSFGLDDCGIAPDGKNWFATGDTENPNTALDRIFAVNNVKIVQENTLIGETGITAADIFFARMLPNGAWFARGDDTADNDWALKGNGEEYSLIAKTGDPITTGSTELWGNTISGFNGNTSGDWLIAGNTTNPDPNFDTVLVLNGTEVILREGDPVDVNGNGKFDDDAFIGNTNVGTLISGFQPDDQFITNDQVIYALVVLRNSANLNIGDAFIRVEIDPDIPCLADIAPTGGDGTVDVDDLILVINTWGECEKGGECPADITGDGSVDVDDLLAVINGWGDCL
jgi:hypothetical protein